MLARVPDTGSERRDRQGPRSAVPLSTIEAIRAARRAGATRPELARAYRLSVRTINRYLEPADPLASAVAAVLAQARREYEIALSRDQQTDIAAEVARMLRQRGWVV
jgi:hypothetical protein